MTLNNVDVAAILAILSIYLSMYVYVLIVFLCWTYSLDYRIT